VYRFALSMAAVAAIFAPSAVAEDGPEKFLETALTRAKKEKKYVSVVFTQFG
jgi:hypothetical protein